MNWGGVLAVMRKDLASVLRNNGVRIPLLAAPIMILVVLPILLVSGGDALVSSTPVPIDQLGGDAFQDAFGGLDPESAQDATGVATTAGGWAVFVIEVFIAPLYLLVPLIVATVIAADSFAGERERGTLEALLHTPTTDEELLTAKFLASWIPAVTVAIAGFAVYCVVANAVAWPTMGRIFFPNTTWLVLAFWVAPGLAALALAVMTVVSSRVSSLQSAHQVGSLLVLPIVLLLIAQVSGGVLIDTQLAIGMGAVVWLLGLAVLRGAGKRLRREHLAARL